MILLPPKEEKSQIFRCLMIHGKILMICVAAAAKSLQSCSTLCNPVDGSLPGSPVPGILQERTLEWVAIAFSNAWKQSRSVMSDSLRSHGLQPSRLLHPWDFPGKSTGVGCHCLLQWSVLLVHKTSIFTGNVTSNMLKVLSFVPFKYIQKSYFISWFCMRAWV